MEQAAAANRRRQARRRSRERGFDFETAQDRLFVARSRRAAFPAAGFRRSFFFFARTTSRAFPRPEKNGAADFVAHRAPRFFCAPDAAREPTPQKSGGRGRRQTSAAPRDETRENFRAAADFFSLRRFFIFRIPAGARRVPRKTIAKISPRAAAGRRAAARRAGAFPEVKRPPPPDFSAPARGGFLYPFL
jgi:hypothetical protein